MLTFEALAILILGFAGGRFVSGGFVGDFFNVHPQFMLYWKLTPMGFFIDLLALLGFLVLTYGAQRAWSKARTYRFIFLLGVIMISCVATYQLLGRVVYGDPYGTHDGTVETEIAASMILHGKNPYAEDFSTTSFARFHQSRPTINQAAIMLAYPYPPLVPLLTLPLVWMSESFHSVPDGRILTMLSYAVLCVLLLRHVRNQQHRTLLVIALLLNPFVFVYPILGLNDIFFVLFLVLAALAGRHRMWVYSGIALGAAVAAKQTALLAAPLWLWWMWCMYRDGQVHRRTSIQSVSAAALTVLFLYGPFLLWNPSAMWNDLFLFVSGSIPRTYPIGGDSLWQLGLLLQSIPNAFVSTAHRIPVILTTLIVLPLVAVWIRRRPTAAQWLTSVMVATIAVSVVNRFFFENYFSAILTLGIAAYALQLRDQEDGIAPVVAKE